MNIAHNEFLEVIVRIMRVFAKKQRRPQDPCPDENRVHEFSLAIPLLGVLGRYRFGGFTKMSEARIRAYGDLKTVYLIPKKEHFVLPDREFINPFKCLETFRATEENHGTNINASTTLLCG